MVSVAIFFSVAPFCAIELDGDRLKEFPFRRRHLQISLLLSHGVLSMTGQFPLLLFDLAIASSCSLSPAINAVNGLVGLLCSQGYIYTCTSLSGALFEHWLWPLTILLYASVRFCGVLVCFCFVNELKVVMYRVIA